MKKEVDPHDKFIADARALLKPSKVTLCKVPKWFRLTFRKAFPAEIKRAPIKHDAWHTMHNVFHFRWLDHDGQGDWGGKPAYISEPYGLTADKVKEIEWLANSLGCEYCITPNSWWYPGSTWRIVFFEREAAI